VEENEAIGELFFLLVDHLIRDEEPLPAEQPAEIIESVEPEPEKEQEEEVMPEMDALVSDSEDEEEDKENVD
jgi:hypothetical protein